MYNTKPSNSIVMKEFERLAVEKGWLIEKSAINPELTELVRAKVNQVGKMLPQNVSLNHVVPVAKGDDVFRAIEVVAYAASKSNISKSGTYHATMDMLSDSDLNKVLSGLNSLESMIKIADVSENKILKKMDVLRNWAHSYGLYITSNYKNLYEMLDDPRLIKLVATKGYSKEDYLTTIKGLQKLLELEDWRGVDNTLKYLYKLLSTPKQKVKQKVKSVNLKPLQSLLMTFTKIPISKSGQPDGIWGPMSSKAWNALVNSKYKNYLDVTLSNDRTTPPVSQINNVVSWLSEAIKRNIQLTPKAKKQEFKPKTPSWINEKEFVPTPSTTSQKNKLQKSQTFNFQTWYKSLPLEFQTKFRSLYAEKIKRSISNKLSDEELYTIMHIIEDQIPMSKADDEFIPIGLSNETEFPTAEELMKMKKQEFKPKLPSWINEKEFVPTIPVKKPITQQKDKIPYTQLSIEQQRKVRSLVPMLMESKHLTQEEALNYATQMYSNASVIHELVSLANSLENMGEVKAALAIDKQIGIYRTATIQAYDVFGETGEQLIEKAHPGGGHTIVPASDEGGKFETIVEEQKKDIERATSVPTGKYAFVTRQLVSLANRLENNGKKEASNLIDNAINKLWEKSRLPLVVNAGNNNSILQKELIFISKNLDLLRDTVQNQGLTNSGLNIKRLSGEEDKNYDDFLNDFEILFQNGNMGSIAIDEILKTPLYIRLLKSRLNLLKNGMMSIESSYRAAAGKIIWGLKGYYNHNASEQIINAINNTFKFLNKLFKTEKKQTYVDKYYKLLNNFGDMLIDENISMKLLKLFKGDQKKFMEINNWVYKEKNKKFTEDQAKGLIEVFINKTLKPLINLNIIPMSIVRNSSKKYSINSLIKTFAAPDLTGFNTSKPIIQPKSTPKRHYKSKKPKSGYIYDLQKALVSLGYPVARKNPYRSDGQWGRITADSWNKLGDEISKKSNSRLELKELNKKTLPTETQAKRAIKFIQALKYIKNRETSNKKTQVHLPGNLTVDESILRDPKLFLKTLINKKIISSTSDKGQIDIAKMILINYLNNFNFKNEDFINLSDRNKDARIQLIKTLISNLKPIRNSPPEFNIKKEWDGSNSNRTKQPQQQPSKLQPQSKQQLSQRRYPRGQEWKQGLSGRFPGISRNGINTPYDYVNYITGGNQIRSWGSFRAWVSRNPIVNSLFGIQGKNDAATAIKYIDKITGILSSFIFTLGKTNNVRNINDIRNFTNEKKLKLYNLLPALKLQANGG